MSYRIGERLQLIKNTEHIELKLKDAAGIAVATELRMRLVGELSKPLREKLEALYEENRKRKKDKRRILSFNYWECDLWFLEMAFIETFKNSLQEHEINRIRQFRDVRNELLHANFVNLMQLLEVTPSGRLLQKDGTRNVLSPSQIHDAIISIDQNHGLEKFEIMAQEVIQILDKIIRSI